MLDKKQVEPGYLIIASRTSGLVTVCIISSTPGEFERSAGMALETHWQQGKSMALLGVKIKNAPFPYPEYFW
jgi:hypothetical protein